MLIQHFQIVHTIHSRSCSRMSSRAFRRLNRDVDVIRISENAEEEDKVEEGPGFTSLACKKKGPVANPFALVRTITTVHCEVV